ncbi:MAG: universal stress protein family [uncultured archaeon A07HN63]|nr:MAG: universal stress protein family [uncultured archaeon A07HN63]
MARQLLVPLDGSPQSTEALDYALETFPEADLLFVHVLTPADSSVGADGLLTDPSGVVAEQRDRAETLFEEAEATAGDDRTIDREVLAGRPATEIVHYAEDNDIDGSSWAATAATEPPSCCSAASPKQSFDGRQFQ